MFFVFVKVPYDLMACGFVNYVQIKVQKWDHNDDPSAESAPDDSECGFRLLVRIISLHIQQHVYNIYRNQLSLPPTATHRFPPSYHALTSQLCLPQTVH